jgi:uncharacterized membrane protein YqiK
MKLYLLLECWNWEGDEVMAIYSSREKAEAGMARAEAEAAAKKRYADTFEIVEQTLDLEFPEGDD